MAENTVIARAPEAGASAPEAHELAHPHAPRPPALTRRRRGRPVAAIAVAAVLLVLAAGASVAFGARGVGLDAVLAVFGDVPGALGALDISAIIDRPDFFEAIVASRITRTVCGIVAGVALAVAGVGLQGATRNPLGDPALFGLTAGASLGVVLGLFLLPGAGAASTAVFAVIGATAAALVVAAVARLGATTDASIVLAGAAVTAGCTAVTSAIVLAAPHVLNRFRYWGLGSISRADPAELGAALPAIVLGLVLVILGARALDALALGDDLARGLGVNLTLGRGAVLTGAVILAGVATALAGPIAFLGLLVPHAIRLVLSCGHGLLIALSALLGPALLLVADTLGRVVAPPGEVAVGVMLAVVGVPVLLGLLRIGPMGKGA